VFGQQAQEDRAMRRNLMAAVVAASVVSGAPLVAQLSNIRLGQDLLPVLSRGEEMTLGGEVVEISCYRQKGVRDGTGANHVACAKVCVEQGKALGLLSEGDGLFRIVGELTADKNAKLVPYIGAPVEVRGAEVIISNNYDARSFEIRTITAAKRRN
jgi:hypothetical protein